jgi:protein arginine kinase activator
MAVVRVTKKADSAALLCLVCAGESVALFAPRCKVNPLDFWVALVNVKSNSELLQSIPGDTVCLGCGLTFEEFSSRGLAGCGGCYEAFADAILPALSSIHSNTNSP